MKWIFFVLFGLNLALAVMHWLDARRVNEPLVYSEPDGAKRLILLQEIGVGLDPGSHPGEKQCILIGPMPDKLESEQLLTQLATSHIDARLIVQEVEKAPGYWVYYGPIADSEEQMSKLRDFQSKDIDSFLINSGELSGAISLGVFENIDSARTMKKNLAKRGYQSKLAEIKKVREEYWVLVEKSYVIENKKKIDNILRGNQGRPESRQIFCKSVASAK